MDACPLLVSLIFVACTLVVWYAIYRRSRGTLIDIERWSYNSVSERQWYVFRLCSVILVIGGVLHARELVLAGWRALKAGVRA
jgi:hypothetical protein